MKKHILNQKTLDFNVDALEASGWEAVTHNIHPYSWTEYENKWSIKDDEGANYYITVSLRKHENGVFVFINGQWIGRAIYIIEANSIVNSIKKHAMYK